MPAISEEITDWIEKTRLKHGVDIPTFAYDWVHKFYGKEESWPPSHRKVSVYSWRKYDYDYKQKSDLFDLDALYRRMPKKSFIRGRKKEFEILFMYFWMHYIDHDEEYWKVYLSKVLPSYIDIEKT